MASEGWSEPEGSADESVEFLGADGRYDEIAASQQVLYVGEDVEAVGKSVGGAQSQVADASQRCGRGMPV